MSGQNAENYELHDIAADPYEKTDLKGEKPEMVQELLQMIEDWKKTLPAGPAGEVFSKERE